MSGFESKNFNKTFSTQPLREFTVGEPEEDPRTQMRPDELEANIREARRQKLENINKIEDAAKKRIEILANIGRLTKDVSIGGFKFSLRTLKAKESREAALATFSTAVTQIEASYEARKQQLARSIFKIDGEDIELIIGSNSLQDKMRFIEDNLEDVVVEKLWNEFVALKEESKDKYGINTVKEAEEVSEDLKK